MPFWNVSISQWFLSYILVKGDALLKNRMALCYPEGHPWGLCWPGDTVGSLVHMRRHSQNSGLQDSLWTAKRPPKPFQGMCEFKTLLIIILRWYLPFLLCSFSLMVQNGRENCWHLDANQGSGGSRCTVHHCVLYCHTLEEKRKNELVTLKSTS